jgi:hypothetical protein
MTKVTVLLRDRLSPDPCHTGFQTINLSLRRVQRRLDVPGIQIPETLQLIFQYQQTGASCA